MGGQLSLFISNKLDGGTRDAGTVTKHLNLRSHIMGVVQRLRKNPSYGQHHAYIYSGREGKAKQMPLVIRDPYILTELKTTNNSNILPMYS